MTATAHEAITAVEAVFDRFHATGAAPGVAFGVIVDGQLAHAGGRGSIRADGSGQPGPETRYRIASMTKSFTASAILALRDDGRLRLDDEVVGWVPELATAPRWAADDAPVTIRSLLTMTGGLPTDDPWGDRQLGLAADDFRRLLASGPELAWPVGERYEYANTGYAILGLVVERAAGEPYRAFVERRILAPLALDRTTFDVEGVDPLQVAPGYVRRGDAWVDEPLAPHGAFAPMGGLFSSVVDLGTWVAAFLAASPARDDPDPGLPLRRSSLREMQQLQRAIPPELRWTSAAEPPVPFVSGYGFGLFVILDAERGRLVTHSGGLPGHGSNMRWHPASGLGIVAAANGRYAPLGLVCRDALNALIDAGTRPTRRPRPWPATLQARATVERLLDAWDDEVADDLFAMNMDLDEPRAIRRADVERVRAVHGRLTPDESEPEATETPAHLGWWLCGERGGRVHVELQMGPERPSRVQWLELVSVPDPSPALEAIAALAVEAVRDGSLDPAAARLPLALSADLDRTALDCEIRVAAALFGPLELGPVVGGDGRTKASWMLRGPRGAVTLSVELAPDAVDGDGPVRSLTLVPLGLTSPVEGG